MKIGRLNIDPDKVDTWSWDRAVYANMTIPVLVLNMTNGQVHRIEHIPQNGIDCLAIETILCGGSK